MYHKKLESDIRCPLEYGLEVFGGKWKSRVICVLADKKTLRYSELRAELVNITDAVLSTTLKALIADDVFDELLSPSVDFSIMEEMEEIVMDLSKNPQKLVSENFIQKLKDFRNGISTIK